MKSKRLNILIFIVVLIIAGLIGVQLWWVSNTFKMQKQAMTRKINEAIAKVCSETEENFTCFETQSEAVLNPGEGIYVLRNAWKDKSFLPAESKRQDTIGLDLFYIYEKDTFSKHYGSLKFSYPVKMEMKMKFSFLAFDSASVDQYLLEHSDDSLSEEQKPKSIGNLSILEMADSTSLHESLKHHLSPLGIKDKISFGVRNERNRKMEMISGTTSLSQLQRSPYSGLMFFDKYSGRAFRLFVHLGPSTSATKSLWWIVATSGLFTLSLIIVFGYFVNIILRQKKLNEMKTDFINNMTHEFKTPITNISLAAETLSDRNGIGLKRFLSIIEEENNRLKENVERILQIAFWENGEQQIQPETLNLHEMLENVAMKFSIGTNVDSPQIEYNLNATNFILEADRIHLQNVIGNLIDNAIKYSLSRPHIVISTKDYNDFIQLTIKDHGIGMDRETQKHIFDKFYRAHTGDLHNVRGFGLGLSYAKAIIVKHGGRISVSSETGKGSEFKVILPTVTSKTGPKI